MDQNQTISLVPSQGDPAYKTSYSSLALFFLVTLISPTASSAADFPGNLKGVTITDQAKANMPPTAVINFVKNGDSFSFDASGSSDSDGSIAKYMWDFGDGSKGTGPQISHSYSTYGKFSVQLTTIDNQGGVAINESSIFKIFSVSVNFQPLNAPIPPGFIADGGEVFSAARGYGWNAQGDARDRNKDPRQEYDTLTLPTPWKKWEYSLPNGVYQVTVCVGDSEYPGNLSSVQLEGVPAFENVKTTSQTKWFEKTVQVTVTDGRLTLTTTGSSPEAQLCWIKIIKE